MPIVSISLDEKMLKDIDYVEQDLGFAGRSELVRAGIRMLIADKKARDELKGHISCVLVVTHDEGLEDPVTEIKHLFDSVVKSHLHYKLGEKKCLELMVLDGNAPEIKEIVRQFQTSGSMDNVKLILP
ncbi:MAG TPA: CopG family ribbon-helix-helix protein [Nitrososphaerales archaeon]